MARAQPTWHFLPAIGLPGSARLSGCGSALPQNGKCGPGVSRLYFQGQQSERRGLGSLRLGLSGICQWLGETAGDMTAVSAVL